MTCPVDRFSSSHGGVLCARLSVPHAGGLARVGLIALAMLVPAWLAVGQTSGGGEDAVGGDPHRQPPRPVAEVLADGLTLAAYNIENAFDAWDDPYTNDESADPKFDYELKALAAVIRESHADVIGVCEVENAQVLQLMIDRYLPDAGYAYVAVMPSNSSRGIHLGVISRLPIARLTSHRFRPLSLPEPRFADQRWLFARDLLEVGIDLGEAGRSTGDDDGVLDLFVVHFKSKRTVDEDDPQAGTWRRAEAEGAMAIMAPRLMADPEALLAITGDFNDERNTPVLKALARHEPGATGGLTDVHYGLPEPQRITYLREPYRSQIDFLLVSDELADRLVPGSQRVFNEAQRLKASDHALVSATFSVEPSGD